MITQMMKGPVSICPHREQRVPRRPGIHETDWHQAGRERWQAFVKANPDARISRGRPRCLESLVTPHYVCKHTLLGRVMGHPVLDHWHTIIVGYKERVIISQPYLGHISDPSQEIGPWETRTDLVVGVDAGKDKSWYFPGMASLFLIGTAEAVAKVNLDYSVEGCAPIPKGCRKEVE